MDVGLVEGGELFEDCVDNAAVKVHENANKKLGFLFKITGLIAFLPSRRTTWCNMGNWSGRG